MDNFLERHGFPPQNSGPEVDKFFSGPLTQAEIAQHPDIFDKFVLPFLTSVEPLPEDETY